MTETADGNINSHLVEKFTYVGETFRPFRERVCEHYQNLRSGKMGSFIINHWMDKHDTSLQAPEFKWKILDRYTDPLRRQLCEGIYILQAGTLNKKNEFDNNLIC